MALTNTLHGAAAATGFTLRESFYGGAKALNNFAKVAGVPGAAVGYLVGRAVGYVGGSLYMAGAKCLNKVRKKQITLKSLSEYSMKPVKTSMKIGAGVTTVAASLATLPLLSVPPISIVAIAGLTTGLGLGDIQSQGRLQ